MSFFTELKRRNVFRVGVAYAIVAWLLIQITSTVAPALHLPDWTLTFIVFLTIIGFPLALFLTWAYELTPAGIKTTAEAGLNESLTQSNAQRLNYIILGLVVLVLTFIIVDNYILPDKAGTSTTALVAGTGESANTPRETASSSTGIIAATGVRRSYIALGERQPLRDIGIGATIAVSRDGRQMVYAAQTDGITRLYLQPLDQLTARPIPGTEGAEDAFFSPDGQWIVYESKNKDPMFGFTLNKVAIAGGAPQRLTDSALTPRGAFWSRNDFIYYSGSFSNKLYRIPASGGTPEQVAIKSEYANWAHSWPGVLPGGTHLLLTVNKNPWDTKDSQIISLSLSTGETKLLIKNGYQARYVTTGHIVFMRSGSLWAVPFDVERLETTGPEVLVVNGVQTEEQNGLAVYAFPDAGFLIYQPGGAVAIDTDSGNTNALVWVDRQGKESPLLTNAELLRDPRISPDGTKVALTIIGNNSSDVWIYDLDRGTLSRRTHNGFARFPLWSPDGSRLVYTFWQYYQGLAWIKADGTGQPEFLVQEHQALPPTSFTPDGSTLIYNKRVKETGQNIYTLSLDDERSEKPLVATDFVESRAALSPDGRWLAYASNESGREEIYIRPYPNIDEGNWTVSTMGGIEPRWRGDSKELYYWQGRKPDPVTLMAVTITAEPEFKAGIPTPLFSGTDYINGVNSYDVAADGQRFLMINDTQEVSEVKEAASQETNLVLVENWFGELKRLAPPTK